VRGPAAHERKGLQRVPTLPLLFHLHRLGALAIKQLAVAFHRAKEVHNRLVHGHVAYAAAVARG